jgi:hypothetical protein
MNGDDDDDGIPGYECEVSCVDWYGNSRPIFTDGRIFALSGSELIEGRIAEPGFSKCSGSTSLSRRRPSGFGRETLDAFSSQADGQVAMSAGHGCQPDDSEHAGKQAAAGT